MGLNKGSSGYHSHDRDGNPRHGEDVDGLLDKIQALEDATPTRSGTMSASDKGKLDTLDDDEELSIMEIEELLNF